MNLGGAGKSDGAAGGSTDGDESSAMRRYIEERRAKKAEMGLLAQQRMAKLLEAGRDA